MYEAMQCLITSCTLRVYLEVTAEKSNNITFFTYVKNNCWPLHVQHVHMLNMLSQKEPITI